MTAPLWRVMADAWMERVLTARLPPSTADRLGLAAELRALADHLFPEEAWDEDQRLPEPDRSLRYAEHRQRLYFRDRLLIEADRAEYDT